jgi:cyclopropane fatty-acyl-phospholipid synthase-like methyltransferase
MMDHKQTGEPQYRDAIELMKKRPERMGLMSGWSWHDDPKRFVFYLSRYKFVAKMLEGSGHVLEAGCGDGFGTRIVVQSVKRVTAVDFDPAFVASAKANMSDRWRFACKAHDLLKGPVKGRFDAVYSLDVLEHIAPAQETRFLANMIAPLKPNGVAIIGMPSLQSQAHASAHSRQGHVNCKDQQDLKRLMQRYFNQVFAFSMNDEVVHTGFHAMSHYNLCLCCGKK